ncbi:hypothetical protein HanOQP8_Chr01g0028811 [Helianthus annuus]|nr:hypothetical protein HanOQP8_Chr01g0028811 [Helianthus annuus]
MLPIWKKRLTSHWRSFIRPLMWRCKWAELKIKQFESQALEYAKKVAARNATKHLASNQSIPEGFSSRSMPYTKRRQRKLMKRRKRARIEDTTDADLYMSQHVLFSYNEGKKSDQDEVSVLDDFDDPGNFILEVSKSHLFYTCRLLYAACSILTSLMFNKILS